MSHATYLNESWHTYERVHSYASIMAHIKVSHGIYMYTYMYVCILVSVYSGTCMYIQMDTENNITYSYVHGNIHKHQKIAYICTYIHKDILCINICVYTHTYVYIHICAYIFTYIFLNKYIHICRYRCRCIWRRR